MKKKTIMLIAGLVLCAVVVVAGIVKLSGKKSDAEDTPTAAASISSEDEEADTADAEEAETETDEDASAEDDKDKKDENETAGDGTEEYSRTPGSGNGGGSGYSGGGSSGGNSSDAPENQNKQPVELSFPYEVSGTSLVIQNVSSYDGVFLEDGSDSDISGVAAIVMKNTGAKDVEYAKIQLGSGDSAYTFEATDIPAGATVVAQEMNRAGYPGTAFNSCRSEVAENQLEQSSGIISVEEQSEGSLLVRNLTGATIPCVRVFYKFYSDEEATYVGGITYNSKLTNLAANDSETISPTHYSKGYSRVVMVRTYDTAE